MTVAMGVDAESSIDECLNLYLNGTDSVPFDVLGMAKQVTASIFNEIGVAVRWAEQPNKQLKQGCTAIKVQFDRGSAFGSHRNTLGYALPYSKAGSQVHIGIARVLRCRFACYDPRTKMNEAAFLGHIMAHEIGHAVQGVARHSEDGLMKTDWTSQDVLTMLTRRLSFTKTDADLIHSALSRRRGIGMGESYRGSTSRADCSTRSMLHGAQIGRKVAKHVCDNFFRPVQ